MKHALLGVLLVSLIGCGAHDDQPVQDETSALTDQQSVAMSDVTILYPLPKSQDDLSALLGAASAGERGPLLPVELFQELARMPSPPMRAEYGASDDWNRLLLRDFASPYDQLRIVGVRLDPCFGIASNLDAPECVSTIRLVAQVVAVAGSSASTDPRLALHLIYEVTRDQLMNLVRSIAANKRARPAYGILNTEVGVQPDLQAEGVGGAYGTALRRLLLAYAGEQTLRGLAVSVRDRADGERRWDLSPYDHPLGSPGTRWVFGRFEYGAGTLRKLGIPTLGNYVGFQTIDEWKFPPPSRDGRDPPLPRRPVWIEPAPTISDNIFAGRPNGNVAVEVNGYDRRLATDPVAIAGVRIDNPRIHGTTNTDCASCHMAKTVTKGHRPTPDEFTLSGANLSHSMETDGPFRMFGYEYSKPIVTARVVNETAIIVDYLNKKLGAR